MAGPRLYPVLLCAGGARFNGVKSARRPKAWKPQGKPQGKTNMKIRRVWEHSGSGSILWYESIPNRNKSCLPLRAVPSENKAAGFCAAGAGACGVRYGGRLLKIRNIAKSYRLYRKFIYKSKRLLLTAPDRYDKINNTFRWAAFGSRITIAAQGDVRVLHARPHTAGRGASLRVWPGRGVRAV